MTRLQLALGEIRAARSYTENLLQNVRADDWFRQPSEGVTHIAWQVGHLAMAQYALCLWRIRGKRPADAELISDDFYAAFGKDSVPAPANQTPDIATIRSVFTRVHEQSLREVEQLADSVLDEPPEKPHSLFNTKLGSLQWCARHEMLHAGQIGLLRRLLGEKPLW